MIDENKGTEIFNCLNPEQYRIFYNVTKYNYPMKYFTSTISDQQLANFYSEISKSSFLENSFKGDINSVQSFHGGK